MSLLTVCLLIPSAMYFKVSVTTHTHSIDQFMQGMSKGLELRGIAFTEARNNR